MVISSMNKYDSSMGKYDYRVIKSSLLPLSTGFAFFCLAVTSLWRVRPDVFGKIGLNLYDLVYYTPLIISVCLVFALIMTWVGVLFLERNTMDNSDIIQGYYKTTLGLAFLMGLTLVFMVGWVYFAGLSQSYAWAGVGQWNALSFAQLPLMVTLELFVGIRLLITVKKLIADGKRESAYPLMVIAVILSAFLTGQFVHMVTQYGGLNTVYSASMTMVMMCAGLSMMAMTLGLIFATVRVYQHPHKKTFFSLSVVQSIWNGLCVYWFILLVGIFIWHPVL